LVYELDRECRAAAVKAAHRAGLRAPAALFVNAEPEALDVTRGGAHFDASRIPEGMRVVVEITERAVTARVADLLPIAEQLRRRGVGIALDDVGADRRSLALMPFLRPDVIKLDLRLVQDPPSARTAEIHNAVAAHAERYGAVVVAEGIETEEHAARARAMGATVGQGWLYGRPGPLATERPEPKAAVPISPPTFEDALTPYAAIDGARPTRRASKRLLLSISRELEQRALALGDSAVLLSTFQHERFFGSSQASRYARLASQLAFVGAFGAGVDTFPASAVRGANLEPSDPLVEEWDVVVVDPHFAGALTARDLGDTGCPDLDRRFDFKLTHDRDLVVRAARSLMARIDPTHRASDHLAGRSASAQPG
ncbi:MAG TPA: EAL domain-containing protein, partial [Thermoleophilaceae bacterium]|nr:EAL domain-containing protein [Thermoleophilaceae bacterium]